MSDYEEAVKQALKDAEDKAARLEEELRENAEKSSQAAASAEEPVETGEEASEVEEEQKPAAEETAGTGKDKKKGIFKKKEEPDKRDELIEELKDKNARLMAEFENFRKRNEKEKAAMFEVGSKSVIEKMLPVIDNFERGFKTLTEEDQGTPFAQGMELVYKQLVSSLEEIGVKPIEAVGKEFDPNLHNAVMHEDNEEVGENIVVEEFQKGYTYRDSVVRFSMVKVAN